MCYRSVSKKIPLGWLLILSLAEFLQAADTKDSKGAVALTKTAGELKIGGVLKQDFVYSMRPLFLNSRLDADRYQYVKNIIDLRFDYLSNSQDLKESIVDLHGTFRHKSYWGNATDSFKTGSTGVLSSSGAKISSHSHDASKPGIWLKDLWIKTRLDKMYGRNLGDKNSIDLVVGTFAFQLGRGISLGSGYGTPKDFLGVYNRVNDFNAPGMLLSTKSFNGRLECDFYWALFESKSSSPRLTLASKREKIIGQRLTPWAGSGNDDQLFAIQMAGSLGNIDTPKGSKVNCRFYDYAMYNNAPAKSIELDYDSDAGLITFGAGLEAVIGRFELGFEGAVNFGQEHLLNIDRNVVQNVRDDSGTLVEQYSHIQMETSPGSGVWNPALVTAELKAALNQNLYQQNGQAFSVGFDSFKSSDTRIRPAFTNRYRGWMFVTDAAWNLAGRFGKFKPAFTCGIVSGDSDPSAIEVDKNYNGFLGLNELYSGMRVKSVIMLDDRAVNRPMTITEGDTVDKPSIKADGSFTDLRFLGAGFGIKPGRWEDYNFVVDLNLLGFWKDHVSKAITFDVDNNPMLSDQDARRYLGTELNMIFKFEPVKNLVFTVSAAAMLPGSYYEDIAGARIQGDAMSVFEQSDLDQIDTMAYTIGKDPTYFMCSNLTYRF
jgi:hypothetical protein